MDDVVRLSRRQRYEKAFSGIGVNHAVLSLRQWLIILGVGFSLMFGAGIKAEEATPPSAPPAIQGNPEVRRLAKALIEDVLQASHASDILTDLRRSLREVYIPTVRDLIQGEVPGVPALDARGAAAMAKVLTAMDYTRRAGDELDQALTENRNAMISDVADEIAKTAKPRDLTDAGTLLRLPAVRKSLDALYAMSKLVTGFTYSDTRELADISAWANNLDVDMSQMVPGPRAGQGRVPPQKKIAKAQTVLNDFLRISHLDEMVDDVKRFAREVYAETAPMSEEARQELRDTIDQFEFTYSVQKGIATSVAPPALAAALTDEQLATLQGFVRSPAVAKSFDLMYGVVKSVTAFTRQDIEDAQKAIDNIDKDAGRQDQSPQEQDQVKAGWTALAQKWTTILRSRISPETLSGLEHALGELESEGSPI